VGKRIVLILVLAAVISGAASAQNFWLSGEGSGAGAGARIELMLTNKLSVGINGFSLAYDYVTYLIKDKDTKRFVDSITGVNLFARLYIVENQFFIGIGLGYHIYNEAGGFGITPEIGWKIDFGKPGGFFISPGIIVPLTFGYGMSRTWFDEPYYYFYSGNSLGSWRTTGYWDYKEGSFFGFNLVPYIGIGYAF